MATPPDISTRITNGVKSPAPRVRASGRPCLIQYNGELLGRRLQLDAPDIVIGRVSAAGIYIPDDSVSREHARLVTGGATVEVEDLGSSNGTFINDQRLSSRTALRDGDVLRVGAILLKFFAQDNIESAFHDHIYRMATVDAGTGLFNRKYLLETLASEVRLSRGYRRPLSVIYYDLDFFKKVNDTHGHACGDFVLRESAQVAKTCLRAEDVLARYGGEEFVVLLPNTNAQTAAALAERIRAAMAAHPFVFEGKTLAQTVSLGVSELQAGFASGDELLADADRKLYQSKQAGRNRVTA